MTVKELIEKLEKMPQDVDVIVPEWGYHGDMDTATPEEVRFDEAGNVVFIRS